MGLQRADTTERQTLSDGVDVGDRWTPGYVLSHFSGV